MNKLTAATRRQFLKILGLTSATTIFGGSQAASAATTTTKGPAKNLIFLVVDGMSGGTLGLAHHWSLRNRNTSLHWMQLFDRDDVYRIFQDTASANSPVTDSAAAASAWGSGKRVNNGAINIAPDGTVQKPIMSYAKDVGKATGLVTTCRLTHATPAGFAANVLSRGDEAVIARQYYEREIDLLLGGGARSFVQKQDDGTTIDYLERFQKKDYTVVKKRSELMNIKGQSGPLLGVFCPSHIPYAIDRNSVPSLDYLPSLPEMFEVALERLSNSPQGFVLQIEAGRVDHAGHANDPGAILHEYLEFDDCIPIALDYIDQHPETLIVITTDHGTAGCQLNGHGNAYLDSGPALDRINRLQYSFEWLEHNFRKTGRFDPELLTEATGIVPTKEQGAILQAALDGKAKYISGAMSEAFGKQLKEMTAVGWTSHNHTSECVDLFALGPGAENFTTFLNNNEVFGITTGALSLT